MENKAVTEIKDLKSIRRYIDYQPRLKKRKSHSSLNMGYPDWFIQQCNEFLVAKKCRWCGKVLKRKGQTLCEDDKSFTLEYLGISMLRKQIHWRDNCTCQECGVMFIQESPAGFKMMRYRGHVHHIKPLSEGGEDEEINMVLLCEKCHKNKHKGEPHDDRH